MVECMAEMIGKACGRHGIVISDHNYRAVASLSDRLMFLDKGRKWQVEDMEELRNTYHL